MYGLLNYQLYLFNFKVKTTVIKASFKIMFPGSFETSINPQEWEGYLNTEIEEQFEMQENEAIKIDLWFSELSSFQKLILIKCCKEEKVSYLF